MEFPGEKHSSIESTQILLKERLQQDPELPNFYSVMATIQTGGRGRGGNTWVSTQGNLHASILLKTLPFPELTWIPLWVSTCVLNALIDLGVSEREIRLKWPNDLWIKNTKKTGGILCEKVGSSIVVGIGLNLVSAPMASQETGSISETGKNLTADEVLEGILKQIAKPNFVSRIREVYEKNALFKAGEQIHWQQNGTKFLGEVQGLGSHGELLVKNNGKTISLLTEDVRSARPT